MGAKSNLLVFLSLFCIAGIWIYFGWVSNTRLAIGDWIRKLPNGEKDGLEFDRFLYSSKDTLRDEASRKIAERLERRSIYVKKQCDKLNSKTKLGPQKLGKLRFLDDQNMFYCPIEKIASVFWGKVFYLMSHQDESKTITDVRPGMARSNQRKLRIPINYTKSYINENYNSFLFVRDTFTRLFSGWLNKFFAPNVMYWGNMGRRIIKTRPKAAQRRSKCGHDISFSEFVNFISKRIISGKGVDGHFSPSADHCNVCDMNFTFIGKYETIKEDAKFIVDHFIDGDVVDISNNVGQESLIMEIKDRAGSLFSSRKRIERCMSFKCGLYRGWQRLVARGIIGKHIPFPYAQHADNVTREQFAKDLFEAHERSDKKEMANNRNEVLVEAYQSLDKKTLKQLIRAFQDDFDLFGYSKSPAFLKHRGQTITLQDNTRKKYKYLQDCPY